jgi:hypothetical protein
MHNCRGTTTLIYYNLRVATVVLILDHYRTTNNTVVKVSPSSGSKYN